MPIKGTRHAPFCEAATAYKLKSVVVVIVVIVVIVVVVVIVAAVIAAVILGLFLA